MSAPAIDGLSDLVLIGRGGFSTVYRARETEFARQVAVKVLDLDATDEDVRRSFDRECEAAGRLSAHPHIVTVHRRGTLEDGRPYLVMELCPGGNLAAIVSADGPLAPHAFQVLAAQIGGAVATAHGCGVLHRDIKPHNALSTTRGEFALGDFGLALLFGSTTTSMVPAGFTPAFAAPELLVGHPATAATDVYGLAATLYFAASGTAPVPPRPESYVSYVGRVLTSSPPPVDHLPRAAAAALMAALAVQPTDRPGTVAEFLGALLGERPSPAPVMLEDITVEPGADIPEPQLISGLSAAPTPSPPSSSPPTRARRRHALVLTAVGASSALVSGVLAWSITSDHDRTSAVEPTAQRSESRSTSTTMPGGFSPGLQPGQSLIERTGPGPDIPDSSPQLSLRMAEVPAALERAFEQTAIEIPLEAAPAAAPPLTARVQSINAAETAACRAGIVQELVVGGFAGQQWQVNDVFVVVSLWSFRDVTNREDAVAARAAQSIVGLEFGADESECAGFPSNGVTQGDGTVQFDDLGVAAELADISVLSRSSTDLPTGPFEFAFAYRTLLARDGHLVRVDIGTNRVNPLPANQVRRAIVEIANALLLG